MPEICEDDPSHPHHHTLLSFTGKIAEIEHRLASHLADGIHLDHRRVAGFHTRLHQLRAQVDRLLHQHDA